MITEERLKSKIRIQKDVRQKCNRETGHRRERWGTRKPRGVLDGKNLMLMYLALCSTQTALAMIPFSKQQPRTPPKHDLQQPTSADRKTKLDFAPSSSSSQRTNSNSATFSPLFQRIQEQQTKKNQLTGSSSSVRPTKTRESAIARQMVLTTPESIIEQASTQNLLDDLIDESVRTSARRPIMMQFDPSRGYIWRLWRGTVFSETWRSCIRNMGIACVILLIAQTIPNLKTFLDGFGILWGQLLSVTTFTLTFFLNQSYALWRKCYELSRRLQGRLNDLGLLLASHATRKMPAEPNEPSTYTPGSRQLLELIARYIRLFNLLTYASFTRSHRPILTPRGMRRMVERGLLTPQERQVLVDAEVPATQRHNAVIMWIMRLYIEGRAAGHLQGGSGYEQQFLEKCHVIRSQYGAIGDELQGRMPLAYVHIVQVLVDVILWLYPVMAFSNNMSPMLGILGTGLLTMTYQGLFDLAKQFLDPYDNENYGKGEDPLCVDTLVAETNSGSVRWLSGFNEMPFSSQRILDSELHDYLLPTRGYSVEELDAMEEDKRQKDREAQEKKEREAAERSKKTEEERVLTPVDIHSNNTIVLNKIALADSTTERPKEMAPSASIFKRENSLPNEDVNIEASDGTVVEGSEELLVYNVTPLKDGTPAIKNEQSQEARNPKESVDKPYISLENATVATTSLESVQHHTVGDTILDYTNVLTTDIPVEKDVEPIVESTNVRNHVVNAEEQNQVHQEVREDERGEDLEKDIQPPVSIDDTDTDLVTAPLTLEDYYERVEALKEAAMEEWKETEAILNAAPGADIPTFVKSESGPTKSPSGKDALRIQEQAILAEMEDSLDALGKEAARVQEQLEKKARLAKEGDSLDALEMDVDNDVEQISTLLASATDSEALLSDNSVPAEEMHRIEDGKDSRT